MYPISMDEELIDKIYAKLIDPESDDPELRKTLRTHIKHLVETGFFEEVIEEIKKSYAH